MIDLDFIEIVPAVPLGTLFFRDAGLIAVSQVAPHSSS
jgi:hypothetical protein